MGMLRKKSHLSVVPKAATIVSFGVVGFEEYNGKKYYVPFGLFTTALEALHYRGAARDLHGYSAYQSYYAVAIYSDNVLRQLHYTSLTECSVEQNLFHRQHPKAQRDLFTALLLEGAKQA